MKRTRPLRFMYIFFPLQKDLCRVPNCSVFQVHFCCFVWLGPPSINVKGERICIGFREFSLIPAKNGLQWTRKWRYMTKQKASYETANTDDAKVPIGWFGQGQNSRIFSHLGRRLRGFLSAVVGVIFCGSSNHCSFSTVMTWIYVVCGSFVG